MSTAFKRKKLNILIYVYLFFNILILTKNFLLVYFFGKAKQRLDSFTYF